MAEPASQRTKIRPAAVAGSFYVGHAQRLRSSRASVEKGETVINFSFPAGQKSAIRDF
jgi:hypothetical protein